MDDPTDLPPPKPGNTLAVVALILGLLAPCTVGLTALPAIICAIIALTRDGGKGLALGGLIFGILGMIAGPILLVVALLLPAVSKVREAANRAQTMNNFKQISLGLHLRESAFGDIGHIDRKTPQGEPGLSIRFDLLPYIQRNDIHRTVPSAGFGPGGSIKPWNSPEFATLNATPVKEYQYGGDPPGETGTAFRAFVGPGTFFSPKRDGGRRGFSDIPDGLANTIMFAESAERVPWPKADEMRYTPQGPLPKLGGKYPGGFMVAMGDGSVRFVKSTVSEGTLRAAITADGNEVLGSDW